MNDDYLVEKLLSRIEIDPETGCWRYGRCDYVGGYAPFWNGKVTVMAHRFAYEVFHGPIPAGHEVDHVWAKGCRHRNCCAPDHLEAVTRRINAQRAGATRMEREKLGQFSPNLIRPKRYRPVVASLPQAMVHELDEASRLSGLPRTALIRFAVREYLERARQTEDAKCSAS